MLDSTRLKSSKLKYVIKKFMLLSEYKIWIKLKTVQKPPHGYVLPVVSTPFQPSPRSL